MSPRWSMQLLRAGVLGFALVSVLALVFGTAPGFNRQLPLAQAQDNCMSQTPAPAPTSDGSAPIPGVEVVNDSPTVLGSTTAFTVTAPEETGPYTFSWSFGDGATSGDAVTQHTYEAVGEYLATVIVANATNSERRTTNVIVCPRPPVPEKPISGLSASSDAPVEANNPVSFVALVKQGTDVRYTWDFGDGSPSATGAAVTHSYAMPSYTRPTGTYKVTVTAENKFGAPPPFSFDITILDESIADLTVSYDQKLVVSQEISFTARVQRGTGVSYVWNWGDGVVRRGQTVRRSFPQVGNYMVTVTASNSRNFLNAAEHLIIHPAPPANLAVFNDSPKRTNEPVTFYATNYGNPAITYYWDFGDGRVQSGPEATVSHVYGRAGKYAVSTSVRNESGGERVFGIAYVERNKAVRGLDLDWEPQLVVPRLPITFTATFIVPANANEYSFTWDFGDGASPLTDSDIITHEFAEPSYPVVSVSAAKPGDSTLLEGEAIITVSHPLYLPALALNSGLVGSEPSFAGAPTATPSVTPSATATVDAVSIESATPTATATATPTATFTATVEPSATATPSPTATEVPTATPFPTATEDRGGGTIPPAPG